MNHTHIWALGVAALMLVACNKDKDEAVKAADEISAACKDDKDKAQKLGEEWYGKNEVFKKAVDAAAETWKVSDVSKFGYCTVGFSEAKVRMAN